jgi:putative lipase involved disintegration of autophagic bodies
MANCLDYAKISYAAYFKEANQYYADPPGHMVDDWTVQKWESGTLFGDGFQGGIWQNNNDVVVGCCGTNPKQTNLLPGLGADLKIALKILPNQCTSAHQMVKLAKSIANGRRVSVTGHSLGGGLAQVVGRWEGVPFVTFNAPAMKSTVAASKGNIFKPMMMVRTLRAQKASDTSGLNFRVEGDLVSSHFKGLAGDHLGVIVDIPNATGGGAHGKGNCWQAILQSDWADIDPFEAL